RKVAIGAANSPAETHADQIGANVASGAAPEHLIVDGGSLLGGQMLKGPFLTMLRTAVEKTVEQELGKLGATAGCPYLDRYFGKYGKEPALAGENLIRHWIPDAKNARSASDLIPLVTVRVRDAVRSWQTTGRLPPDLAAAEPDVASQIETQNASPSVHKKSLDGMEAELGEGRAADSRIAAPMGAQGAKIHEGPIAARMAADHGAVAFAAGNNVVMGANAPAAGTPIGDALLAHELAHTAQQRDAASDPAARKKPIGNEDQAAETDADRQVARLGNFAGRIGDVMRTGVQLQRCHDDAKVVKQDRGEEYYQFYRVDIAKTAAAHVKTLPFSTGDDMVQWNAGPQPFADKLAEQLGDPDKSSLADLVRPESIRDLVDSARVLNEIDGMRGTDGPEKYFEGVGVTIGNAIARRTHESLQREVPRYVQARFSKGAKIAPSDLMTSAPIDTLVVKALIDARAVDAKDSTAYAHKHPELAKPAKTSASLRVARLKEVEKDRWWRLEGPMDATIEEVAFALFNDTKEAFRIENAHPLYGANHRGLPGDRRIDDVVQDKRGTALGDEIALNQAAQVTGVKTQPTDKILAQLRFNSLMLKTSVVAAANRFGLGNEFSKLAGVLDDRVASLENQGDAATQKWNAQVQAQAAIITQGNQGLENCATRLEGYAAGMGADLAKDPAAFGLPEEYRFALRRDAEMWVDAINTSDTPKTAEQRLRTAAEHSRTLEIE
ncbi:MAG TPA: DUF4157 domain-containing protein, partial [Kofleriaceae bacterium]|nr:DUF4157 domain-containing protein [Kofleriaceae bacterium]